MLHSKLSPSSASKWVHCNGMPEMIKDIPDVKSDSAVEGDAAHWLSAAMMQPQVPIGSKAPNGYMIDQEMINHITPYVTDILNTSACGHPLHVEERIAITRVHKDAFGTPDCWYFDFDTNTLYVWDLKYGWGIVEVVENWQMIMYSIGIVDWLKEMHGIDDQDITIHMTLGQPRPYHKDGGLRTWVINGTKLRPYANTLEAAANNIDPKLCSGSWCKNCKARTSCSADRHALLNAIDVSGHPVSHETTDLDYELQVLERIKDIVTERYKALEDHVISRIKKGDIIPGRSLQSSPGRGSKWIKPLDEIVSLGDIFNINLKKDLAVLTPNQAINAGIPEPVVKGYSEHNPSSFKLVRTDLAKLQEMLKK